MDIDVILIHTRPWTFGKEVMRTEQWTMGNGYWVKSKGHWEQVINNSKTNRHYRYTIIIILSW